MAQGLEARRVADTVPFRRRIHEYGLDFLRVACRIESFVKRKGALDDEAKLTLSDAVNALVAAID